MLDTRLTRLALAAGIAGALGACAPVMGGSGTSEIEPRDETATATLEVENNHWYDMRVYAIVGGIRSRLGTVASMAKRTLQIPRTLLSGRGELRIMADPVGPREFYVSEPVYVGPGERVELRIENHLPLSTLSVWR